MANSNPQPIIMTARDTVYAAVPADAPLPAVIDGMHPFDDFRDGLMALPPDVEIVKAKLGELTPEHGWKIIRVDVQYTVQEVEA